jgi:hypothetical protein
MIHLHLISLSITRVGSSKTSHKNARVVEALKKSFNINLVEAERKKIKL